jgi:pimeloyl-ACP methyl ester carboxylesterase
MTSEVIDVLHARSYRRALIEPRAGVVMYRREFLRVMGGAAGAIGLAGCESTTTHTEAAQPTPCTALSEMNAATFNALRRFAETRFGRIAYVERGSGPAALFLHGFPLSSFQWRGALTRLSPYRRCIAPDFLGLGFTQPAPGQSLAPDAQVEMLAALLDELGVASVDLVANDSGGAVAQLFVVRHPSRVRTLMLTNCDVENDSPPPALLPVIDLAREGKFADAWLAPWLKDKALARSPEGLGGMCYTYPTNPTDEAIEQYLAPLLRSPETKARLHAYALGLTPNPLAGIEAALKRSALPTRIVWGSGDTIFSRESPHYLDRVFPNSRGVRIVEGAKLFYAEEFPDLIAEEARRLWGV